MATITSTSHTHTPPHIRISVRRHPIKCTHSAAIIKAANGVVLEICRVQKISVRTFGPTFVIYRSRVCVCVPLPMCVCVPLCCAAAHRFTHNGPILKCINNTLQTLTIEFYVAVHVAPRIFGDAFVVAVIAALHIGNRQPHCRLVRWMTRNCFGSAMKQVQQKFLLQL